jgi:diadenosine tetraphosphatase ApaH/serine/threonine PP2A family protein phosphatase
MASLWKQPLGVLASSGAIQLVDDVFFPQMYEGFKIQVTPFNYHEDGESEASFFTSKRLRNTDYHILMTHGAVAPDKEQLPYPHVTYTEFPKRGVDMVLCGHLHHDYGSQLVGGTEFVQYGSLARRSRTQMRDVVVPLIDLHRNSGDGDVYAEVVPYKLKCAVPWQDVFVSSDTMPEYLIDPELTDLARDARSMMSLDDLDFGQVLSALEVPEPVMARVRHYMEEAGYGTGS